MKYFYKKNIEFLNTQGFTLVEVMMGTVLMGSMMALAYFGLGGMQKSVTGAYISNSNEVDLNQMVQQLVKVGRSALNCKKVDKNSPKEMWLECEVDDGAGVKSTLRFYKSESEHSIRFESQDAVDKTKWIARQEYGGKKYHISEFTLCDTSDMAATPSKCSLHPTEMSTNYPTAKIANRFFRFRIGASDTPDKPSYFLQSSFFVRNPAPDDMEYVRVRN